MKNTSGRSISQHLGAWYDGGAICGVDLTRLTSWRTLLPVSDWLKILLSALAGMVTGVLLEPIRHWIANKIAAHYAKQAIYAELGRIYAARQKDPSWLISHLHCEAFDYYYESKRDVIYLIPEYHELISLFNTVHRLRLLHQEGKRTPAEVVKTLVGEIERRIATNDIDVFALRRGAAGYSQRISNRMAQIRAARSSK